MLDIFTHRPFYSEFLVVFEMTPIDWDKELVVGRGYSDVASYGLLDYLDGMRVRGQRDGIQTQHKEKLEITEAETEVQATRGTM